MKIWTHEIQASQRLDICEQWRPWSDVADQPSWRDESAFYLGEIQKKRKKSTQKITLELTREQKEAIIQFILIVDKCLIPD